MESDEQNTPTKKTDRLIGTENGLAVARGEGGWGSGAKGEGINQKY